MSDLINNTDSFQRVRMRLRLETISKIDELKRLFETSNRTNAMVLAVRLAHSIASEMNQGARIELHRPNGDVSQLMIGD